MKSSLLLLLLSMAMATIRYDAFSMPPTTTTKTTTEDYLSTMTAKSTVVARGDTTRRFFASNDSSPTSQQQQERQERTIRLRKSGRDVTLVSRTLPIGADRIPNITVWEWKNPSEVVNAYWDAQTHHMMTTASSSSSTLFAPSGEKSPLLDPFGLMTWPGSVRAARELCRHADGAVRGRSVVVLGAGVGVETQAAALLGARQVLSTDVHPTTVQQLEFGTRQNENIPPGVVRTQLLDLFDTKRQPLPTPCDLLVVADVLYSEQLATQVCRRCAEAYRNNPSIRILITDSQRFVPRFVHDLNAALKQAAQAVDGSFQTVQWQVETMEGFTGSGVMIDDDQTYDVKVQHLWVGL